MSKRATLLVGFLACSIIVCAHAPSWAQGLLITSQEYLYGPSSASSPLDVIPVSSSRRPTLFGPEGSSDTSRRPIIPPTLLNPLLERICNASATAAGRLRPATCQTLFTLFFRLQPISLR